METTNESTLVEESKKYTFRKFEPTLVEKSKKYTFRKFESPDVFIMLKLLSKIGFKDFKKAVESEEVKESIKKAKEEGKKGSEIIEAIQLDIILCVAEVILSNVEKCQNEIYKMLSSVSDLTEEEVKKLSAADFASMVIDFVKREDFEDFIKVVSRLFK